MKAEKEASDFSDEARAYAEEMRRQELEREAELAKLQAEYDAKVKAEEEAQRQREEEKRRQD